MSEEENSESDSQTITDSASQHTSVLNSISDYKIGKIEIKKQAASQQQQQQQESSIESSSQNTPSASNKKRQNTVSKKPQNFSESTQSRPSNSVGVNSRDFYSTLSNTSGADSRFNYYGQYRFQQEKEIQQRHRIAVNIQGARSHSYGSAAQSSIQTGTINAHTNVGSTYTQAPQESYYSQNASITPQKGAQITSPIPPPTVYRQRQQEYDSQKRRIQLSEVTRKELELRQRQLSEMQQQSFLNNSLRPMYRYEQDSLMLPQSRDISPVIVTANNEQSVFVQKAPFDALKIPNEENNQSLFQVSQQKQQRRDSIGLYNANSPIDALADSTMQLSAIPDVNQKNEQQEQQQKRYSAPPERLARRPSFTVSKIKAESLMEARKAHKNEIQFEMLNDKISNLEQQLRDMRADKKASKQKIIVRVASRQGTTNLETEESQVSSIKQHQLQASTPKENITKYNLHQLYEGNSTLQVHRQKKVAADTDPVRRYYQQLYEKKENSLLQKTPTIFQIMKKQRFGTTTRQEVTTLQKIQDQNLFSANDRFQDHKKELYLRHRRNKTGSTIEQEYARYRDKTDGKIRQIFDIQRI